MRFALPVVGLLALLFILPTQLRSQSNPHIAATPPRTPEQERKLFHLPPGFEAQLVAAEPDIYKPMNLAFDDRGRLWVTSSVEYPFPAKGRPGRDRVTLLDDFGPDGRARKVTQFASDLNIPIGLLPLPGAREALVYSIPQILRLRDTDGDGRADRRETFLGTFGFNDTHGMTSAFTVNFDGWIHACHGFSNQSSLKAGADTLALQSGNTYRVKPDGSRLEWYTHGQVNPFGLALDPLGYLYSADCHSQPVYQLIRGGFYPSFGKPHDGLGFAPEMTTEDHGGTGLAGIVYYAADQFPAEYRDTIFIGNVITCRVNHDKLTWHGSSPRAKRTADFLVSDDPWFRPVDLKLGPDGALYIADFYNCIIGHYEVPLTHPQRDRERGRIWRIVYTGKGATEAKAPRADWTRATVPELIGDFRHPNLTVRMTATNELARRGGDEVTSAAKALFSMVEKKSAGRWVWQRAHGLWVLERCGRLDAATLTAAARDPEPVRVQAMKVIGERGKGGGETPPLPKWERALVLAGLKDPDPHVRRAAAEALGLHPDPANIAPLLTLLQSVPAEDTHLLYVVRMALRDQLRDPAAWTNLPALSGEQTRMIVDVALGVPTAEAAAFARKQLSHVKDRDLRLRAVHHVARHGSAVAGKDVLSPAAFDAAGDLAFQAALFRAAERGTQERGAALSAEARAWAESLAIDLIRSKSASDAQIGLELVGSQRIQRLELDTQVYALSRAAPENVRAAALGALAALDAGRHAAQIGRVLADADAPSGLRDRAANLLARANRPEALAQLVNVLPAAPARLQVVIAAGMAETRPGAEKLLDAATAGKASARLLQDGTVLVRLDRTAPDLKPRRDALTRGLPPADQKVQELMRQRRDGFLKAKTDPDLGGKIFEKSCAICHQLRGQGAKVGPQLDGIGIRGLERLLEDTLDPSRNVDQAFRQTTLTLKNGQVVNGLVLREEGAVLVLADQLGKDIRVLKANIEERTVSPLSPMPSNFADQVSEADFYNLLAFLLSQRPTAK
jgi:putative membrane-bound dehydrogenase-like protein